MHIYIAAFLYFSLHRHIPHNWIHEFTHFITHKQQAIPLEIAKVHKICPKACVTHSFSSKVEGEE